MRGLAVAARPWRRLGEARSSMATTNVCFHATTDCIILMVGRKTENQLKAKWLCSIFVASALAAPAFGQIHVYVGVAPPPIRYEVQTAHAWRRLRLGRRLLGRLAADHYVWVPGVWQRPPYAGCLLEPSALRPLPARVAGARRPLGSRRSWRPPRLWAPRSSRRPPRRSSLVLD